MGLCSVWDGRWEGDCRRIEELAEAMMREIPKSSRYARVSERKSKKERDKEIGLGIKACCLPRSHLFATAAADDGKLATTSPHLTSLP
jgi:hypothetical protein